MCSAGPRRWLIPPGEPRVSTSAPPPSAPQGKKGGCRVTTQARPQGRAPLSRKLKKKTHPKQPIWGGKCPPAGARRAWAGGTPAVPMLRCFQATSTAKIVDAKLGVTVAGLLSLPKAHVGVKTLPRCSLGREAFIYSWQVQFYVTQASLIGGLFAWILNGKCIFILNPADT